ALAAGIAVLALALLAVNVLAGPRPPRGTVLVLASAATPDRLAVASVSIRTQGGSWQSLSTAVKADVPQAPQTVALVEGAIQPATYDRLRVGDAEVPLRLQVQGGVVTPVLLAITEGRPVPAGVYVGNDNVNLGL